MTDNYFSVLNKDESIRLKDQQDMMMKFDFPVFERIFSGRQDLNILDLGCNNGRYAMMRLGKFPGLVDNYVGIEYDDDTVRQARSTYGSDKVSFYCTDLESDSFLPNIEKIMEKKNIEKFDLILMSMTFMHIEDKETMARKIRSLMSKSTTLVVVDVDDGLNVMDPDPEGYVSAINMIMDEVPITGTRRTGREIPEIFHDAGFRSVKLEACGLSTIGLSPEAKKKMFSIYEHIPSMLSAVNDGTEEVWKQLFDETIDGFREQFFAENTVYSMGLMFYTMKI